MADEVERTPPLLSFEAQVRALLSGIDEISKHSRTVLLALLVLLAYVLLAAFGGGGGAPVGSEASAGAKAAEQIVGA